MFSNRFLTGSDAGRRVSDRFLSAGDLGSLTLWIGKLAKARKGTGRGRESSPVSKMSCEDEMERKCTRGSNA